MRMRLCSKNDAGEVTAAHVLVVSQGVLTSDINLLDYFVCGEVERVSDKYAHLSREALKRTIHDTMEKID